MNPDPPDSTFQTANALRPRASTGRFAAWLQLFVTNSILASTLWVFVVWLVSFAMTGIAADKESPDGLTAQQILDKMAMTYGSCRVYRDSGVVTNDFGPRPGSGATYPRHVDIKPFRTAFVRPDRFRFEYDDAVPEKPYIVWKQGDEVRTWWHLRPKADKAESLEYALAGATGVSGGSAHTIPALLMPDSIGGRKLTVMTDLKRQPDETLDGTLCFKLEGKFAVVPTTLWLDKATFLLVRMVQDTSLTLSTTVYKPQMNTEIPAAELEFNAPEKR
jgi:outer membrane lipoprotein-sorting protein